MCDNVERKLRRFLLKGWTECWCKIVGKGERGREVLFYVKVFEGVQVKVGLRYLCVGNREREWLSVCVSVIMPVIECVSA